MFRVRTEHTITIPEPWEGPASTGRTVPILSYAPVLTDDKNYSKCSSYYFHLQNQIL